MKSKTRKIILSVVIVIAVLASAFGIYFYADSYPEFYAIATKQFQIPGLETAFVPQGIEQDPNTKTFLISGYMSNGEASRIYLVDQTTYGSKYFTLSSNGTDYVGHCGGIAIDGDFGWIVGDGWLHRFNFLQALDCQNGEELQIVDSLQTGNGADFVLAHNGKLIVGEFFKQGKYETHQSHHIKIDENQTNKALAYVYNIDHTKPHSLASTTIEFGISLPNQVQGMTFNKDGKIVLSTSYSIPASKLLVYENVLQGAATTKITVNEQFLDVYVLADEHLTKTITACPMSEEIVLVNGKIYVLFESACKKYKLINREVLSHVYALDI